MRSPKVSFDKTNLIYAAKWFWHSWQNKTIHFSSPLSTSSNVDFATYRFYFFSSFQRDLENSHFIYKGLHAYLEEMGPLSKDIQLISSSSGGAMAPPKIVTLHSVPAIVKSTFAKVYATPKVRWLLRYTFLTKHLSFLCIIFICLYPTSPMYALYFFIYFKHCFQTQKLSS